MYINLKKIFLTIWKRVNVFQNKLQSEKIIRPPTKFIVKQNRPNPFNPTTRIHYRIPKDIHVKITVFNEKGEKIIVLVSKDHEVGYYHVDWDARDRSGKIVRGGVYFYQFQSKDYVKTRKMVLLK